MARTASALGQGIVQVGDHDAYLFRYADWIVTTPLLLAGIAWTAMFYVRKHVSLIVALMGADVIMILSGLMADASGDDDVKWLWYGIGCVCLGVILYVTWAPLRRIAFSQEDEVGRTYVKAATFLSALWLDSPLFWAQGPSGAEVFDRSTDVVLFVLLPILSKVGFSLYDLSSLRKLGERRSAMSTEHSPTTV